MTEHTNTPELRFPEFKDEWKLQKLGNLAQFSKGKSLSKKDLNINGKPCILYGELYTKYGAILNKVYSKTSTQNDSLVFSKRNQILIPSSGETDIDIATATAIDTDVKIAIGGDLNIITPINSDGRFISLYINGKGKYNLAKYAQGKSVVHLYNSDIKKLNFYLPTNMAEQKKIGDFFSKLDQQIELEEKRLELLEQQKKGYMQQIFSQDLRFKDENGDAYPAWKETTIKEIAEIKTGSKDTKDAREDGNYNFYVRSPIIHKINSYSYDGEAILTVGDGVGVGKVFHYVNGKFDYHQRVYKISDFKNYYGLLLYYYFSKNFLKEARKYNAKTSVDSVRKDMIANMKVPMPIMEEQQKIGDFLVKIDKLIENQSKKIDFLKQRKKGLLQKMFV